MNLEARTLLDKVWDDHVVVQPEDSSFPATLAIDLHLIHEVTTPQAFIELGRRGLKVRCPGLTLATMDHSTPTDPELTLDRLRVLDAAAVAQLEALASNCKRHGIPLLAFGDSRQGIVHVVAPELGLTQPGATVVCGDSHTSTPGAFGCLAFGIGTGEVAHVLATQSLLQRKPKAMEVRLDGDLPPAVTAKDLILAVIAQIGVGGGTGHVIEYTGTAIESLSMEERMTVCNMSIEAGARAGMIAPDETTFAYLEGRTCSPAGASWDRALARWKTLHSDDGAVFDRRVSLDASKLSPMVTYGTNPGTAIRIEEAIPQVADVAQGDRRSFEEALRYMELEPGQSLAGQPVDMVFLGSCTNSRLSDLEAAAQIITGKHVAPGVEMLVVPGSQKVKAEAELRGLDRIFREAGAQWREAGCSMCLAMNGDRVGPGQLAVSTSNRNFEGRQGPGARTLLASPLTAAATAIRGVVTDPREVLHA